MGCGGRLRAAVVVSVTLCALAGCGIPERAGRGASEGLLETLTQKARDREAVAKLAEEIPRLGARGLVDELSRPERMDDLQRIAAALAAGMVMGTSKALGTPVAADPPGAPATHGARPATPVEALSTQAARSLSREMAGELGRSGGGPLGTSLSATAGEMSAAMARGAGRELGPLFPECQGPDAPRCLDLAAERLGHASAAGIAAGFRERLGPWPYVLAFAIGAVAALLLAWAASALARRRRRSRAGTTGRGAFVGTGAREAPRSAPSMVWTRPRHLVPRHRHARISAVERRLERVAERRTR